MDAMAFSEGIISILITTPRIKEKGRQKISIRPLMIGGEMVYQMTSHYLQKVEHKNFPMHECQKVVSELLQTEFKQGIIHTKKADYIIVMGKKGATCKRKPPTKSEVNLLHNRKKEYILTEGDPILFLVELGIMAKSGKVFPDKMDKFKQINRFLEIVRDTLPALEGKKTIHILDFGCGKAYLTFALYHYLGVILGLPIMITGLDRKEEVLQFCTELANRLHYDRLQFVIGDIASYNEEAKIDMMVALHACDTATDVALAKAVKQKADIILAAPCCQHELLSQIQSKLLSPLLQHPIIKERLSALVTDAARAKLLELQGYTVQIIEFIDMEHTPKNLLIRAIRKPNGKLKESLLSEYEAFTQELKIRPVFADLIS